MNILFVAANPVDTNRLGLDEEIRTIDQRLRAAGSRDKFDLVSGWAARPADLSGLLLRYKPYIVHFSGHGSDQGEILLQDNSGNRKPVSPAALAGLFRAFKANVRCVVLNACFSATQAQAIAKEIDCVVGMSQAVGDQAAIDFAGGFYEALGYDQSVQTAFDLGCVQIDLDALGEADTPRILVKDGVDASQLILTQEPGTSGASTTRSAPAATTPRGNPGAQVQKVQAALLSAFPRKAVLAQMVMFGLGKNLDTIAGGDTLADIATNLVQWAIAENQLPDLIRAARAANQGNLDLKAVAAELGIE